MAFDISMTGFVAVLLGAGNAAGGFAVTQRMLAMFQTSAPTSAHAGAHAHARVHHLHKKR